MPIRRWCTVWGTTLVSEGAAVLLGLSLLSHAVHADQQQRAPAPVNFDRSADLRPWLLTAADLPPGWYSESAVLDGHASTWPGVRTAWTARLRTADGARAGMEQLLVFASAADAAQWMARARVRQVPGGPRCCAAVGDESFTLRYWADGSWVVEHRIRQQYVVMRVRVRVPSGDLARPPEPCSATQRRLVRRLGRAVARLVATHGQVGRIESSRLPEEGAE